MVLWMGIGRFGAWMTGASDHCVVATSPVTASMAGHSASVMRRENCTLTRRGCFSKKGLPKPKIGVPSGRVIMHDIAEIRKRESRLADLAKPDSRVFLTTQWLKKRE